MASGQVRSSASISAPSLVYISSDVQVIEDYREPIFYTSSYYWRYDGGVWYRSTNYTRGWVRISVVPVSIQRIERPASYVHYRGSAHVRGSSAAAHERRDDRKEAQEERKEAKAEQKEERQEAKAEQKEERKEAKAEQKEERKESKAEQKDDKKSKR